MSCIHLGNLLFPNYNRQSGRRGWSFPGIIFQVGLTHTENYFSVLDADILSLVCYGSTRTETMSGQPIVFTSILAQQLHLNTQSDNFTRSVVHNGTSRKSVV